MAVDLATQQEMIENLTKLLEANTVQLQYTAQNSNAFFLIVMAVIIYCKETSKRPRRIGGLQKPIIWQDFPRNCMK